MTEIKTKKIKTVIASTDDTLEKYQQMVQFVSTMLGNIDSDVRRAKLILNALAAYDPLHPDTLSRDMDSEAISPISLQASYVDDDVQVVEGLFDGYFMVGSDNKKYPVPLNYASKTKLIPGDMLKLKILPDGKFIYKLIRPAERQHIRAVLSKTEDNKFIAITDDAKTYFLNQAAVTFFKGKAGDELYIVANSDGSGSFAAIEAIIKK